MNIYVVGSETLITRIIHILTEKTIPSPELVDRVRQVSDKLLQIIPVFMKLCIWIRTQIHLEIWIFLK
jgi:hypothetical protein